MTDRSFFMDAEQEISGESWEEMGMERYAGVEDDADGDDNDNEMEEIGEDHGRRVLAHILAQYHTQLAALLTISLEVFQEFLLATERAKPIPYHTSILSGEGWVKELCNGHPERIRRACGSQTRLYKIAGGTGRAWPYPFKTRYPSRATGNISVRVCDRPVNQAPW